MIDFVLLHAEEKMPTINLSQLMHPALGLIGQHMQMCISKRACIGLACLAPAKLTEVMHPGKMAEMKKLRFMQLATSRVVGCGHPRTETKAGGSWPETNWPDTSICYNLQTCWTRCFLVFASYFLFHRMTIWIEYTNYIKNKSHWKTFGC